jgi:polyisoprenoid-binding protein YceI
MMRPALLLLAAALPTLALAEDVPAEEAPAEPAAAAEPAGPVSYTVDSAKSVLIVRTYKGGIAGALAHDHAIRSMKTSGSVTWQEGGAGCNFDITVDVPSFRVDHASDRKIMGLEGEVDAGQVEDITKNMHAKDQLNVAAHKTMSFKATNCDAGSATGSLTIVGNSATKKVPLAVTVEGDELRAKGTLQFKFSDFGIEPYSTGFGAIQNLDKLTMKIDLRAKR